MLDQREEFFNVKPVVFVCNSKLFDFLTVIFRKRQFRRRLLGMYLRGCLNCSTRYCFLCFFKFRVKQFEGLIGLRRRNAQDRSLGVVFSKMFVLRSIGNELVPRQPKSTKNVPNTH